MNLERYVSDFRSELELKNYSSNTIRTYISMLRNFLNYFSQYPEPKSLSEKLIKQYIKNSSSLSVLKQNIGCLKLFYKFIIKQPFKFKYIEYPKKEKKLPRIIDHESIVFKIDGIKNIKHKAILSIAYSVGLRVSEVINLKIKDIDSKRMLIHIRNSKGKKDRYVPLSQNILFLLRKYYKQHRPIEYLFNGQNSPKYSTTSCNNLFKKYIDYEGHFHLLRHASLTHCLESGTDISLIQKLAGHNSIKSTMIYTHVSNKLLQTINTPL